MKYGCIGEKLKHSFSKEIHGLLSDYQYEICEVSRESFDKFMSEADFCGINVTIPYKESVIPYLDFIDEDARKIGAVNTIVKRSGKLCGYNTDFYGMTRLIKHANIDLSGKTVAVLGTGGTSKTARAVAISLGAGKIIVASRKNENGYLSYEELHRHGAEIDVIINTTPLGMYPNSKSSPVDLDGFPNISGVIDAIYNPLRTVLISEAISRGISAEGGLYMLVAQALRASEIFLGIKYPDGKTDEVYEKILKTKENIVLIGMPSCGKSTVGALLSKMLGRELIDTDDMIVNEEKKAITEIFSSIGEGGFRELEASAISRASAFTSRIISTGGGAVLREENVKSLKQNGRLYFLDRPLDCLIPTDTRPLASDVDSIKKRYEERYDIYSAVADERIPCEAFPEEIASIIGEKYK